MGAILLSDIYLKDAKSVDQFHKIFLSRLPKIEATGGRFLQVYANQEDPLHLMFLAEWKSREHYETYMAWAHEQPDREIVGVLMAKAPGHAWFDEVGDWLP
jgi:quinol monooxygenase YgiN